MRNSDEAGREVGSKVWWDRRFAPSGDWEQNKGRRQTRVFAERFCRHVIFSRAEPFALLDFGCALGDAIRVFHRRYARAVLTGLDFSETAISRCRCELGNIAAFGVGTIDDVVTRYDVIYTSNVLEHLVDYRGAARALLAKCDRLCIMVPFEELDRAGNALKPGPGSEGHYHTFYRDSFDFLVEEGRAETIRLHTVDCPGAWGWDWKTRLRHNWCKNLFRRLKRKRPRHGPLQIIYDIRAARTEALADPSGRR